MHTLREIVARAILSLDPPRLRAGRIVLPETVNCVVRCVHCRRAIPGTAGRTGTTPDFIKDMGIALAEAERMNLCLPGLALAKQLYEAVRAQGYGRKGTHALLLALETLNNVKR